MSLPPSHLPAEEELTASPSAFSVYRTIFAEGLAELARSGQSLFWSGLAAGLSMGFSLLGEGLLGTYLPDEPWKPLITKFGYAFGFVVVILGRQQLFTENTVTPIFPLFSEPSCRRAYKVARLCTIVLVGNLLGACLFALILHHTQPLTAEAREEFLKVASKAMHDDAWRHFYGGIFAGWIVATIVWLLPFAGPSKVVIVSAFTYLIGLGGFSHIIAGTVEAAYVWLGTSASLWSLVGGVLLPTLLGNTLGGVALVAAINHAQAGGRDIDGN
ncbi:MAG: formate/nitrite transporter family protein [Opitutales bacterium]